MHQSIGVCGVGVVEVLMRASTAPALSASGGRRRYASDKRIAAIPFCLQHGIAQRINRSAHTLSALKKNLMRASMP
ncbi:MULTISPECIES: hypothetical protein [Xanthomonas]|uniref:hypothetical protein n=1 Tax=Xanthomonas TaxID=338 RepID=UPI0012907DEC|nr:MULTISPECIES: hypothetical protein [Xanthomonas]MEA9565484.1 hypothetical protein [Xanthomonas sp. WHRI 8932A]